MRTFRIGPAVTPNPDDRAPLWATLLVPAVLVLLPLGRSAEALLALGAIGGLVLLARGRARLDDGAVKLVLALFGAYWLAALLSGFAAVAPGKTWSTVATTLRFLPFALYATTLAV